MGLRGGQIIGVWVTTGVLVTVAVSYVAQAAGKKQLKDGKSNLTTPKPVRKVVLKSVQSKEFQLPNGARIDLTADLGALLSTATSSTGTLAPADPGETDLCDSRIEVRAAVSTLELNVLEAGVKFGYTPTQELVPVTNLNGSAKVKVGTVSMEFGVWECAPGGCWQVAASSTTQAIPGVELSFTVDFSQVHMAPSLVYNTPLGNVLRKMMNKGMSDLTRSSMIDTLSWHATVREFSPSAGILVFDAGTQARIFPNQSFVVYAVSPATGICNVYKAIADVHTTEVDVVSSEAVVDRIRDSHRSIKEGDLVMVKRAKEGQ